MTDYLSSESRRFLPWALVYALAQLMVLLFLTRMVDLAQQPPAVYFVFAAVHGLAGLLLGLYQMGGYRRPSAWLNLLHRPLAPSRIAAGLFGAGVLLLAVAVLLPMLTTAAWQALATPRVLDLRHVLLCLAGYGVALAGYFTGCAAMLLPRRTAAAPLVFLALLPAAYATGPGALALLGLAIAWLLALALAAFKPDLGTAPRGARAVLLAVPAQVAVWLLLVMAGFGVELLWIAQGSHPNNLASAPAGSAKEADNAEGPDLIVAGLAGSRAPDAPLWREQAAISDILTFGVRIPETAIWNELTNREPMEFDDEERRLRWVFSHDRRRFVGYRLGDDQAVGELGLEDDADFPSPPIPGPRALLIGRHALFQYDEQTRRVLRRLALPDGEVIAGLEVSGDRLAVLGDRALYLFDARPLANDDAMLATTQRVPLPAPAGVLQRVDVLELLDGHLVSFTVTRHRHNGKGPSFQQLAHVDAGGRVTQVARRELSTGYGPVYRWQTWWFSPAVHATLGALRQAFSPYQPGHTVAPPPRAPLAWGLALGLMALSLLGAVAYVRRTALPARARLAWCLGCAAIGVPALVSLWAMVPRRDPLA